MDLIRSLLQFQIEKIVLFLLEQQGLLASRIAKLGEQHEALQQQPDISQISELREAYRAVGRDLLKLLFFVEINAIGLRKILKKFDKRFGYRFTDYYVKTRANHPYSQLQQVFKHVVICPRLRHFSVSRFELTLDGDFPFLFLPVVFNINLMGTNILMLGGPSYISICHM